MGADTPTMQTDARALVDFLADGAGGLSSLLVLTHDHPDPDALASAWALAHLAHCLGRIPTKIVFGGSIGRAENRTMAKLLDIPASPLESADLETAGGVALVDTQPSFANNSFEGTRRPAIVVDHHQRHPRTEAELLIVDHTVGATTTILAEAIQLAGAPVSRRLATAIVYGIGSETQNLGRESSERDAAVYLRLLPAADRKVLWRIANPPQPAAYFRTLASGLRDAFVCEQVIGVHLRELPHPDGVARMADLLLTHEGMRWALVTGRYQGMLHVSIRAADPRSNAAKLMKRILGADDRGGGHRQIAGGSLSVGPDAPEERWAQVEDGLRTAFLKIRGIDPRTTIDRPFR